MTSLGELAMSVGMKLIYEIPFPQMDVHVKND